VSGTRAFGDVDLAFGKMDIRGCCTAAGDSRGIGVRQALSLSGQPERLSYTKRPVIRPATVAESVYDKLSACRDNL